MPSRCIHGKWANYCLACKAPVETPAQKAEKLDHTPLTFGKYKGMTPSQVAEGDEEGAKYLVWLYDTVKNKPTCSETLARDCGWKPPMTREQAQAIRQNTAKAPFTERSTDPKDLDDPTFDPDTDIPF